MPPTPLLPAHFATWTTTGVQAKTMAEMTANDLRSTDCLPSLGDVPPVISTPFYCLGILKEDGLTRVATGMYEVVDGGAAFDLRALEFTDATGAYSAYTFYRTALKQPRITAGDVRAGKAAAETTTDADGALLWAGTVVVRVRGPLKPSELDALKATLPKVGGRRGLSPLLPTYLPGKGLDAASARYALGPLSYQAMHGVLPAEMLGWDKSAETLTARYQNKGEATLLLYPTPQISGDRGRAIEKYLNDAGPEKFGTVKLRRVGPLLGLTTGGLPLKDAEALVNELHLSQDLSYDKPMPLEFHAEVKKTATLLESIALFVGLGTLAAIVLAVFLGGARAGIRVLRGKSAASEPEFLTINLRDQPKRLFSGEPTPSREDRPDDPSNRSQS